MSTPVDRRASGVEQTADASPASDALDTAAPAPDTAAVAPAFGPSLQPGDVGALGPYRVLKELGRGGMGAVYAGIDTRLNRRLALKVMLPKYAADPAARERFLREARAAAQVAHDNVVTVYEADERGGVPYIAMQFLDGYPLDEYLVKKGLPTIPQVLRIAREAAAGLAAAHRLGLVHRDVKPGNLWLEAPHGRVKVLDFGLAKPVDAEVELTKSGAVVGTPAYMSPEQARGERVDHRTDLFSLGAVLYRLTTGRLPFNGPTTMAVLMALGTEDPPPVRDLNPAVPQPLADLIHQLLAKKASARPASADEVVERVRTITGGGGAEVSTSQPQVVYVPVQITAVDANPFADIDAPSTRTVAVRPPAEPPRAKWPWVAGAGMAAAVLAAAGVIVITITNKDGSVTELKVPGDSKVEVNGKLVTPPKAVPPKPVPPVDAKERAVIDWVLSKGGRLMLHGDVPVDAATTLPAGPLRVSAVYLSGTAVTNDDLPRLTDLGDLGVLSLNNTPVTEDGFGTIARLTRLGNLDVSGTKMSDRGVARLKGLVALATLNLASTAVTDDGMKHLTGLPVLSHLVLNSTPIGDAGVAHLARVPQLARLHLHRTAVTDAGLAHLAAHPTLAMIDLTGTEVSDRGLAKLHGVRTLGRVVLNSTKVTAEGRAALHAAVPGCRIEYSGGVIEPSVPDDRKAAEWVLAVGGTVTLAAGGAAVKDAATLPAGPLQVYGVNLAGNVKTTDDTISSLDGCRSLSLLDLSDTAITDRGLAHFKGCTKLTHISLARSTSVTDAGLAHFKDMLTLHQLDLMSTSVTDAGLLTHLRTSRELASLNVRGRGTFITAKGLADFHAAVPKCRIAWDGGVIEPAK